MQANLERFKIFQIQRVSKSFQLSLSSEMYVDCSMHATEVIEAGKFVDELKHSLTEVCANPWAAHLP